MDMSKADFMKFDTNKLRFDLIPPEVNTELAKVFTYGAKKYKPNNWKACPDTNIYVAAAIRHLEAHRSGVHLDDDSGLLHISHALTNLAFITFFTVKEDKKDATI